MFTVIAGALSYAGYIAVRLLGSGTGLLVTSAAGALISSTAVAVEFARQARDGAPSRRLAGAASLACMVSAVRVMALITIVQPKLLMPVAPPALAATLAFGLAALLLVMSEKPACEGAPVKSETLYVSFRSWASPLCSAERNSQWAASPASSARKESWHQQRSWGSSMSTSQCCRPSRRFIGQAE